MQFSFPRVPVANRKWAKRRAFLACGSAAWEMGLYAYGGLRLCRQNKTQHVTSGLLGGGVGCDRAGQEMDLPNATPKLYPNSASARKILPQETATGRGLLTADKSSAKTVSRSWNGDYE